MGWVVQLWPRMGKQDIGRAKKHRNVSTIGEDGIFVLCTCAQGVLSDQQLLHAFNKD